MKEPTIRFPVICPACKSERLTEFSVAEVASALIEGRGLHLHADCHRQSWVANELELEQIREYLGAPWLDAQR